MKYVGTNTATSEPVFDCVNCNLNQVGLQPERVLGLLEVVKKLRAENKKLRKLLEAKP